MEAVMVMEAMEAVMVMDVMEAVMIMEVMEVAMEVKKIMDTVKAAMDTVQDMAINQHQNQNQKKSSFTLIESKVTMNTYHLQIT